MEVYFTGYGPRAGVSALVLQRTCHVCDPEQIFLCLVWFPFQYFSVLCGYTVSPLDLGLSLVICSYTVEYFEVSISAYTSAWVQHWISACESFVSGYKFGVEIKRLALCLSSPPYLFLCFSAGKRSVLLELLYTPFVVSIAITSLCDHGAPSWCQQRDVDPGGGVYGDTVKELC